jgi:hypothetical protein
MRVRKPASVYTKSFVFRPGKELHGKFSIGLAIESFGFAAAPAMFEWCGSKRQLDLVPPNGGFVTNFRLPRNLSEGDVYVLSVSGPGMLIVSVIVNGDEEAVESIAIEEIDDGPAVQVVCADPTTLGDRPFEDTLAVGRLVKPVQRPVPLGQIKSLRPFPDGGVLILNFRRPVGAETASNFLIHASVGELRSIGFMDHGRIEVSVCFRLQPVENGESWPLTLSSDHAFVWSGTVHRNFDTNFLPAFSLVI